MALGRPLVILGKAALVAVLIGPPGAIWLSGRFDEGGPRELRPPISAPLATLPRSEAVATPSSRLPTAPDAPPTPASPASVGPGTVTVPAAARGVAAVPAPRAGQVVGEPQGVPDPNRSEATPR